MGKTGKTGKSINPWKEENMTGAQRIKDYDDGTFLATQSNPYVTREEIKAAWVWITSSTRNWQNNYNRNDETIDLSGGWHIRLLKGVGMTESNLEFKTDDASDQCAKVEYSKGRYIRFVVSRRCTSRGVIRAMVMHEFMEAFTGMTKFGMTSQGMNAYAHDYAYNVVIQFNFEEGWERDTRRYNFTACLAELEGLNGELKRRNLGLPAFLATYNNFYLICSGLANRMRQMSPKSRYIPGYYETYEKGGYKKTKYSMTIPAILKEANARGIFPVAVVGSKS